MAIKEFARNEQAIQADGERLKKEAERAESGGVTPYTLQKGKTTIRILPPYSDKGLWYQKYFEHVLRVAGRTMYLSCPREPHGRVCPLCDAGEELYKSQDEKDLTRADDLRPTERYLVNAIVLSDGAKGSAKDGVRLVKIPKTAHNEIIALDNAVQDGWGDVTNLKAGFNLTIERTGDGQMKTRYAVRGFPERTNILTSLKEQGVDPDSITQHNLDEVLPPRSHEDLVGVLEGTTMSGRFPQQAQPVAVEVEEDVVEESTPVAGQEASPAPEESGPAKVEEVGADNSEPAPAFDADAIEAARKLLEQFTVAQAQAVNNPQPVVPPEIPDPPKE
jgi:hypothetical protein